MSVHAVLIQAVSCLCQNHCRISLFRLNEEATPRNHHDLRFLPGQIGVLDKDNMGVGHGA